MRLILAGLFVLGFLFPVCAQYPNSPIAGWKMREDNGHVSFAPVTLFGAPSFHYDVYPPQRGVEGTVGDWLSGLAQRDAQASGYTVVPGQTQGREVQSFRIFSLLVKDAAGKSWLISYMAFARPDHSVRYGRIVEVPNAAATKNNTDAAVQHFIRISKAEGALAGGGSSGGVSGSGVSAGDGGSGGSRGGCATSARVETPTTVPGQGLKPSEIKGVVLHTEYGVGVGGMMIVEYNPSLLLTDGTIYADPYVCAYDLDVARSRQVEPKKWGTWKQENATTLVVTMNSDHKPDRWEGKGIWFWASPAKKGEKLEGTWSTIGGGGNTALGGGAIVVSSNVLTFNNQGQFTTLSTGGGTFSGATGTVTAYSNRDAAGTYTFDGYSLELKYNNGTVVRKNFCAYDDSREVWVFGTRPYTPDKGRRRSTSGNRRRR